MIPDNTALRAAPVSNSDLFTSAGTGLDSVQPAVHVGQSNTVLQKFEGFFGRAVLLIRKSSHSSEGGTAGN